jgi:hypothetical protein
MVGKQEVIRFLCLPIIPGAIPREEGEVAELLGVLSGGSPAEYFFADKARGIP